MAGDNNDIVLELIRTSATSATPTCLFAASRENLSRYAISVPRNVASRSFIGARLAPNSRQRLSPPVWTTTDERIAREDAAHAFQRACGPHGSDSDFSVCVATWGIPLEHDDDWDEETFPVDHEQQDDHLRASYMPSMGVQRGLDRHREQIRAGTLRKRFVLDSDDHAEDAKQISRKPTLSLMHAALPVQPPVSHDGVAAELQHRACRNATTC
ncbi:hypothetical protein CYMTET_51032 [Cymbomonas tetramitiformis]|uniref:Uncharacterized protein n=1 Tax=Cymbomonas tetramitiformis TaxID=36881 RepID=A0AAE0BNM2_9CHLO|nr:hypothetical protein CYMTET_51032 [Cymbomonas tetramitiformis]